MIKDRLKKSSVSIIAILLIFILMALPTGSEDAAIYKGTDRVKAKVLSTSEDSVISNGLIQSGEQYCKVKILGGKFKGQEANAVNMRPFVQQNEPPLCLAEPFGKVNVRPEQAEDERAGELI